MQLQAKTFDLFSKIQFQCRTRLCGWCSQSDLKSAFDQITFQCRTRLCGWCSGGFLMYNINSKPFQCRTRLCGWCSLNWNFFISPSCAFQCRTRLCGWCSKMSLLLSPRLSLFQCRTRLCGWCSFVALSSCPPKRKKAFWKVSGNLRCLTENDAGERSTSANHTSFYSCSWDVFPYDLFPVQLCPMGLLLGQVSKWRAQRADRGAHAARGFVGGAAIIPRASEETTLVFQCRTRLCGWCSLQITDGSEGSFYVSMPHAALWVVQQHG